MRRKTSYAAQRRRILILELALYMLAVTALTAASVAMYYAPNLVIYEEIHTSR